MNYYEHHLGDYESATAHLSWLEDCAYRRLISLYYRTEAPIPSDIKQACRLVRAATKPERDAVQQVLNEFFEPMDDGWHNTRCDADLAEFLEAEPEREAKRENAKERQRRARERRAQLFDELRRHNVVPAWDSTTKALETLLSQHLSRVTGGEPHTAPVTLVTRDNTATHTHTQSHTQIKKDRESAKGSRIPPEWTPPPEHLAFAESLGLRNGRAAAELDKFRDYWAAQPGQKGVKTDWSATWRNWCRRAVEDLAGKPGATAADALFDGVH